jgi:predicted transcriptional regulator YheO
VNTAAVWLFSNPVKSHLDDLQSSTQVLQTLTDIDKSQKQLDKPIDIDCQKVLNLYESGITVIELSERLNCSRQTIYNYIKKAKKTNLKPITLVVDNSQKNKIREVK